MRTAGQRARVLLEQRLQSGRAMTRWFRSMGEPRAMAGVDRFGRKDHVDDVRLALSTFVRTTQWVLDAEVGVGHDTMRISELVCGQPLRRVRAVALRRLPSSPRSMSSTRLQMWLHSIPPFPMPRRGRHVDCDNPRTAIARV